MIVQNQSSDREFWSRHQPESVAWSDVAKAVSLRALWSHYFESRAASRRASYPPETGLRAPQSIKRGLYSRVNAIRSASGGWLYNQTFMNALGFGSARSISPST